jgi:hypothetical protein
MQVLEGESEFVLLCRGLALYGLPLLIATPPARETPKSHRGRIFLSFYLFTSENFKTTEDCSKFNRLIIRP